MPVGAKRGGKARLMLINEYLTLKFNFHLLANENYCVNTAGDGPRMLGFWFFFFVPQRLILLSFKKKVRNVDFK